ncbi:FKBP-type peptidyl-prolyl cis-trans isomerase [Pedobacter panaciterrae]|jgi:FKBP-type peptidyl-prolyl cis-trans isomerases 1|uniref:Peptidyl-prolyl cis-trans isomerase n=1 Tax=Pedobacter panaciterrae TaxID=363849 RepID=A0ABU8NUH5_9SPHI|nr:FKBP-type peptidyl-prolyl cis-trans isomerase [Pedobacter panaciterrae]NQX53515.1 FKBP-type peptidyl-prolyl cis-trans isomerase [Pedobacter panaciterrae]
MLRNRLLLGIAIIVGVLAACTKPEVYDEKAQFEIDETIIKDWAVANKVTLTKDTSGLYYRIDSAGTGADDRAPTDTLTVEYEGRLMTDSVFSRATADNPFKFIRESVMPGWRIGLSLIKPGGRIELLVPSKLAYKNYPTPGVPANSVLYFIIDYKKVAKKVDKQK